VTAQRNRCVDTPPLRLLSFERSFVFMDATEIRISSQKDQQERITNGTHEVWCCGISVNWTKNMQEVKVDGFVKTSKRKNRCITKTGCYGGRNVVLVAFFSRTTTLTKESVYAKTRVNQKSQIGNPAPGRPGGLKHVKSSCFRPTYSSYCTQLGVGDLGTRP